MDPLRSWVNGAGTLYGGVTASLLLDAWADRAAADGRELASAHLRFAAPDPRPRRERS